MKRSVHDLLVATSQTPIPCGENPKVTATHYSMVLANSDRPDTIDSGKASADELRALWGPLLANAGTYEVSGDLITIHPVVAAASPSSQPTS